MELLDKILYDVSHYYSRCYIPAMNSFLIMYECGIRHDELNESKLYLSDNKDVCVISSKHSNLRIIDKNTLSAECYNIISNFTNKDIICSKTTLSNYFNKFSYPYRISDSTHNILLHSFRYNYVKRLKKSGLTISAIQQKIGHKSIKNTEIYYNKELIICNLHDKSKYIVL